MVEKPSSKVVCEIYPEETAEFWRAPGITKDETPIPASIVCQAPSVDFDDD